MNQQAQPTETETTHQPAPKHRIWVKLGMVLLAVATLLVGGYLFVTQQADRNKVTYLTSNDNIVCVSLNGPRLQCENLETGEQKQYSVPESLGELTTLQPSPDQTKYLASGYAYKNGAATSTQAVLDSNFAVLYTLPGNDSIYTQYSWHGNDALVQVTDTLTEEASSRTVAITDLTGKTMGTIELPEQYADVIGSDGENVFMRYAKWNDNEFNGGSLMLVSTGVNRPAQEIDISNFTKNPDGEVEITTDNTISYDPAAQAFYANTMDNGSVNPDKVFKVGKLDGTQLKEVARVNNQAMDSPTPVITSKGFWVNNYSDAGLQLPERYELAGPDEVVTQLKLPVSSQNFFFSLQNFPNQNGTAVSPDTQAATFVSAPADTPDQITNFLETRVTTECPDNNFNRVTLIARDGVDQIITSESGCSADAAFYYIYADGIYNQVYASQEGISCETRDKLGLSKKLVPDCRKPGEGL